MRCSLMEAKEYLTKLVSFFESVKDLTSISEFYLIAKHKIVELDGILEIN